MVAGVCWVCFFSAWVGGAHSGWAPPYGPESGFGSPDPSRATTCSIREPDRLRPSRPLAAFRNCGRLASYLDVQGGQPEEPPTQEVRMVRNQSSNGLSLSVLMLSCLFVYLSVHLFSCLSVCLSICLVVCLLVCLYAELFVCLSICLSIHFLSILSIYLVVCLSIRLFNAAMLKFKI